jgi:class 3 adenylate cyclase
MGRLDEARKMVRRLRPSPRLSCPTPCTVFNGETRSTANFSFPAYAWRRARTHEQDRRLAAILAADVAGYSRLMGVEKEGTLERLKALRRELVDPKIAEHHGRIVKTTGDGMLVEFASVVDAMDDLRTVGLGHCGRRPRPRLFEALRLGDRAQRPHPSNHSEG